jgi:hypothetical protein
VSAKAALTEQRAPRLRALRHVAPSFSSPAPGSPRAGRRRAPAGADTAQSEPGGPAPDLLQRQPLGEAQRRATREGPCDVCGGRSSCSEAPSLAALGACCRCTPPIIRRVPLPWARGAARPWRLGAAASRCSAAFAQPSPFHRPLLRPPTPSCRLRQSAAEALLLAQSLTRHRGCLLSDAQTPPRQCGLGQGWLLARTARSASSLDPNKALQAAHRPADECSAYVLAQACCSMSPSSGRPAWQALVTRASSAGCLSLRGATSMTRARGLWHKGSQGLSGFLCVALVLRREESTRD